MYKIPFFKIGMEIKYKHKKLLIEFVKNKMLSFKEIESIVNTKKRSVYIYIDEINYFLKSNNFLPITKFLNYGFSMNEDTGKVNNFLLTNNMYIYNQDERIEIIALNLILNSKIHIQDIVKIFQMDIKTVRTDIKKTIEFLESNEIKSYYHDSYLLIDNTNSNQINIRGLLSSIVNNNKPYVYKFIDNNLFNEINLLLKVFQNKLRMDWTNNYQIFLNYFLQLLILKIKNNGEDDFKFESELKLFNEDEVLKIIDDFFISKNITLSKDNKNYLLSLLMCGSMITSQKLNTIYPYEKILNLTKVFLDEFEKTSFLKINKKDLLIDDLVKHLIPCYYRSILKMQSFLPKILDIETKYSLYFDIAKYCLKPLEKELNINLCDVEISYIILHIISNVYVKINSKEISIGIFCSHPLGIYKMIENILLENFNNIKTYRVDNLEAFKESEFDIILSTNYFDYFSNKKNVIYIKKFIDSFDIEKISLKINEINNSSNGNKICYTLINNDMEVNNLIDYLTEPFLNEYIDNSYVNALKENIDKNLKSIMVGDNTIVLHASPKVGVIKKNYAINVGDLSKTNIKIKGNCIKYFIVVVPTITLQHLDPITRILDIILLTNESSKIKKEIEKINDEN